MAEQPTPPRPDAKPIVTAHASYDLPAPFRCPGHIIQIDSQTCVGCGQCAETCLFDAISLEGPPNEVIAKTCHIHQLICKICGVCIEISPGAEFKSHPISDTSTP